MVACVLTTPLLIGVMGFAGNDSLIWHTSPLQWPTFEPLVALALVPLLAPLVRTPRPPSASSRAGIDRREPELLPSPTRARADRRVSAISYSGVSFGYPDGPLALDDVSLEVQAGEILLVVGSLRLGQEHAAARRERPGPPLHRRPVRG